MLEKAQSRQQRAAFDFESQYENLCYLSDISPLRSVKASIAQGLLDINGDLLRSPDWPPLLDALKTNKSLSDICLRSNPKSDPHPTGKENNNDNNGSPSTFGADRLPPIRTRDVTYRLCLSLKECLSVSPAIVTLQLQGIPLRERDVVLLAKGLKDNGSIVTLSLEGCQIGDKGAEIVCDNVKKLRTLKTINLASCGLSASGAEVLSLLIRHQSIRRHDDAWKDSLRYRRPELDVMAGIRRITLNGNGLIGDDGVRILAETLKDDLWIKALDMQRCSVTTKGASVVLDVMKYNTSIVVLDLRRNAAVDGNVLRNVMEHVLINANGKEQEFQWLPTSAPDATTSTTSRGGGAVGGEKSSRPDSRSKHRGGATEKRPKDATSSKSSSCAPPPHLPHGPAIPPHHVEYGVPHFTAERAMRHGCASSRTQQQQQQHGGHHLHQPQQPQPHQHHQQHRHPMSYPREEVVGIGMNGGDEYQRPPSRSSLPPPPSEFGGGEGMFEAGAAAAAPRSVQFARRHSQSSLDSSGDRNHGQNPPSKPPRQGWIGAKDAREGGGGVGVESGDVESGASSVQGEMKKLRVDFEQCWRHLQEETKARRQAEERIVELTLENSKLQQSVEELEERANSVLDDDAILDSIETTFTKFHSFLDLLKEVGLGQLISYAGIEIPPPVTPNQSLDQTAVEGGVGGTGGDSSIFAAPTPLKKQLNISESTRNFMSEQVSRILQESVMKQTPAARMQQQQQRRSDFQQPLPPKRRLDVGATSPPLPQMDNQEEELRDASMDYPGYNYREKMKASQARNRRNTPSDPHNLTDYNNDESVFNPIVTSSRVWNQNPQNLAAADYTDSSDLIRGDPILEEASNASQASRHHHGVELTPEEDDVYARLLRRARETTGYDPYSLDGATTGDFTALTTLPSVLLPPEKSWVQDVDRSLLPQHLVVAAPMGFDDSIISAAAAAAGFNNSIPAAVAAAAGFHDTIPDAVPAGFNDTVPSVPPPGFDDTINEQRNRNNGVDEEKTMKAAANRHVATTVAAAAETSPSVSSREKSGSDDSYDKKAGETTVLSMPELEEYKSAEQQQDQVRQQIKDKQQTEQHQSQQQHQSAEELENFETSQPNQRGSPLEGITPNLERFQSFEEDFNDSDSQYSLPRGGPSPPLTPPETPPTPPLPASRPPSRPASPPASAIGLRSPRELPDPNSPVVHLNSVLTSAKDALRKTSKLDELIEANRVVVGMGKNDGGSSSDDATEVPSFASSADAAASGQAQRKSSESAQSIASDDDSSKGGERVGRGGRADGEGAGVKKAKADSSSLILEGKSDSSAVDLEDILSDPDFNENYPNF